ncbi:MAG: DNA-processing protein DprA [Nitrospirota bacterium]
MKKDPSSPAGQAGSSGDDLVHLLALAFANDVGPMTARRLLAAFGSPRTIFEASLPELESVGQISASRAHGIKEFDGWDKVTREIAAARERGIAVVPFTDAAYPGPLKQLDDAPIILYIKGTLREEDRYAIAIVGSRDMTDYGRKTAENLAFDLAARGLTVVSGMARGIDTVSHRGALRAGGRSIAVLGCGLDRPYPSENKRLFTELCDAGAVISEFPLGAPPLRENFPRRNRLISGLALGVVVVEATMDSGSLITAQYALDQGKDIFAVPGNISIPNAEGTNSLIRKGARLVQRADDIIEELAPVLRGLLRSGSSGRSEKKTAPRRFDAAAGLEISDEEKAICTVLGDQPKHVDTIARELKIAPPKLLGLLLRLEIKGIVRQTEGKNFYIL